MARPKTKFLPPEKMRDDLDENGNYIGGCSTPEEYREKHGLRDDAIVTPQMLQRKVLKVTDKQIAEALEANMGIVTPSVVWLRNVKHISVHPNTLRKRIEKSQYLLKVQAEMQEKIVDVAEHKLYGLMKNDDARAITYILKTKGRKRGWGETAPNDNSDAANLVPKINITFLGGQDAVVDTQITDYGTADVMSGDGNGQGG